MPNSNIKFIPIQNKSVILHVWFVLFLVCLYICICECLLQNNNLQTKHKNDTNCGSASQPGAAWLPYYCASICVRSWCNWRASSVDSKTEKKQKWNLEKIFKRVMQTVAQQEETDNVQTSWERSWLSGPSVIALTVQNLNPTWCQWYNTSRHQKEIMSQHFHIWWDKQTIQGFWQYSIW